MARQKNCGHVLFFTIGVHLLLIAANMTQNLCAEVLRKNGYGELGFYSVGLMNGVLGFSAIFMPPLVEKLKTRKSLSIGTVTWFIYIGCQMFALT
jgi:hypothetical protein